MKGIIAAIVPDKLLTYTVIDPNAPMPDIPENYLTVTYKLWAENGLTKLTVLQDGFEGAAARQKMIPGSVQ